MSTLPSDLRNPAADWSRHVGFCGRDDAKRTFGDQLERSVIVGILALITVWAAIVSAPLRLDAQTPAATIVDQSLHVEIARMDSLLFAAFNAGDLTRLRPFFEADLEFYQDNEGLENYAQTMKDFQEMFHQPSRIRRELVSGSLEVYPIKNYGAIEIGSHRFCHEEKGRTECGTFKFLHVWRKTGKTWRLSRIVSYAH